MLIELTWWVMPLLFTILCFAVAWAKCQPEQKGGYFPDVFTGLWNLGLFGLATIGSLVAWLAYFIIF